MACVVEGCKSHTSRKEITTESVTFHRFPKVETDKDIWVRRLSRHNWTPKKHSHICSKHFTADSFVPNENIKYRRLKANAIPTLYLPDETKINEMELNDLGPSSTVFHFQATRTKCEESISDSQENTPERIRLKTRTIAEINSDVSLQTSILDKKNSELEIAYYKRKIGMLEKEIERVKKVSKQRLRKINTLTKRNSRHTKRNSQLYDILIEKLKDENIELEHQALLDSINKNDIIKRVLQKQEGETLSRECSLELKKFAVTLHHLSPRAYTFVRDHFQKVLPHPKTITAWYQGIDCNPGFTTEALDAIKFRVEQNPDQKIFCETD